MSISRRQILSVLASLPLASVAARSDVYRDPQESLFSGTDDKGGNIAASVPMKILPKGLSQGSKIAITAPASPTTMGEISAGAKFFKSMGCEIEVADTIKKLDRGYKYLSAPDEKRAEEFMSLIERDDIDCILTGRGGYGVMRILPMLDFDLIQKKPKIIMGYSDITALVTAVYELTNIVAFHGAVASSKFNSFTNRYLKETLFRNNNFKPIDVTYKKITVINEGKASGKIVGGNLTMIVSALGTKYEVDTNGAILFLEEVQEHPYKIDRMLTQLWLAGKLQSCAAICFGVFSGLDSKRKFYPGYSYTIREVIYNRIKPLGIPSVLGMPFGHIEDKIVLPIGGMGYLDTSQKKFSITEPSVS